MTVLLTGGTGFVGRHVARELGRRGCRVRVLAHRRPAGDTLAGTSPAGTPPDAAPTGGLEVVRGSLADPQSLRRAALGCDAAIHLVGIIEERPRDGVTFRSVHVEGTRNLLAALADTGVSRLVHMSALGTRENAVAEYHRTKWEAEQLVRGSGLRCTLLRPGLIHGRDGDFIRMAVAWARGSAAPWLFMPYFGRGLLGLGPKAQLQPVAVEDVARAVVDALTLPATEGQTYALAGTDRITWPELHRAISSAVRGRPKAAIPLPAWYAELLARTLPASWIPFNLSQAQMASEDNTARDDDLRRFAADFGFTPRGFHDAFAAYASHLR